MRNLLVSSDTSAFLTASGETVSRADLWSDASVIARDLGDSARGQRVLVDGDRARTFLTRALGIALAGGVPVMGRPGSTLSSTPLASDATTPIVGEELCFQTSGSTGTPTRCPKNWAVLEREAREWIQALRVDSSTHVFSLVPPFHIYGFLHAILVPWISGGRVTIAEDGLTPSDEEALSTADIVIAVPASFAAIERVVQQSGARYVISSGAPLGASRIARIADLVRERDSRTRVVEILGSSETGGIGWRDVSGGGDPAFDVLAGVNLRFRDEGAPPILRSPYLFPERSELELADRLAPTKGGFTHLGRVDRVFKWGAQRHSLDETENATRAILGVDDARVLYRADETLTAGGDLIAFAVNPSMTYASFRRAFVARFPGLPCPRRLVALADWPRDPTGKITAEALWTAANGTAR